MDVTVAMDSEEDMQPQGTNNEEHMQKGSSSKKGRGSALLKELTKILRDEDRLVISYNCRGQPRGPHKASFASYQGILAKSVPINIRSWHKVSKHTKDNLWRAVQVNNCPF